MNKHERFVKALMVEFPNPSPVLAAYIEHYRQGLPILRSGNTEAQRLFFDVTQAFWSKLTTAEQAQVNEISRKV